ncbi:anaerobic ribonucleoside-triphosphate reductase activating protein [Solidesulfovibrio fructosivorans JJ]]|uniref:Anaerobic ribonucleoside-triphosphate reductase activating protein n=2 Tax=Solidesulfovibrio fructosivorans TaxID=878 RepID=E1JX06_SOLFR|nr:anaerobic ribonucleoside-triphosphate reductase activating protein [Solidesulfovibrio fructosivorans JJ]]
MPLSTLDYPGELAAVLFCRGCPWRCPYCHNATLRESDGEADEAFADTLPWLESRQGLLDAVVFSGGEPTAQPGLPAAMTAVRDLGFKIGLHTAGMFPDALADALPYCDWVGCDIKAPAAAYGRITGVPGSAAQASASLQLLEQSHVAFEVRTTWHPALLTPTDMTALADELDRQEVPTWVIQPFQPKGCADENLSAAGPAVFPDELLETLRQTAPGLSITVR